MHTKLLFAIVFTGLVEIPVVAAEESSDGQGAKLSSTKPPANAKAHPLSIYLTPEEYRRANTAPSDDEQGARWKVRLPPSSRKQHLLGRPSTIVVQENGLLVPFEKSLIGRSCINGATGWDAIRPLGPPEELVTVSTELAYTFKSVPATADIVHVEVGLVDRQQCKLSGHTIAPWRLMFPTHHGSRLISCSDDGSMRLWDLNPRDKQGVPGQIGQEIAKFPCYSLPADGQPIRGEFADFAPRFGLATEYNGTITLRDPRDGSEMFVWKPELPDGRRITAIRFAPDSKSLFAFLNPARDNNDDTVQFLHFFIQGRQEYRFRGRQPAIYGIVTNGQMIVTTDGTGAVSFWEIYGEKIAEVLQVAPNHLYDMTLSPLGETLVTAGDDGEAKFWDVAERKRKPTEKPFRHDGIDYVRFTTKGDYLVTASDDGWLKVWDAPEFTHDRREVY